MATGQEISDDAFRQLLLVISEWYDQRGYIDMLKVLYRDHVKYNQQLNKASRMMDLLELLKNSGDLHSSDLTILYDTIKVTGQFGLERKIKDILPSFQNVREVKVSKFKSHRRKVVKLGLVLKDDEVVKISELFNTPVKTYSDSWSLIMDLEHRRLIHKGELERFIGKLNSLKLTQAAAALTEGIPVKVNLKRKRDPSSDSEDQPDQKNPLSLVRELFKHKHCLTMEDAGEFTDTFSSLITYYSSNGFKLYSLEKSSIVFHLSTHDPIALMNLWKIHLSRKLIRDLAEILVSQKHQQEFLNEWMTCIDEIEYKAALGKLKGKVQCDYCDFCIISDDTEWENQLMENLKQRRPDINGTIVKKWRLSKPETTCLIGQSRKVVIGFSPKPLTDKYSKYAAHNVIVEMLEAKTLDDANVIPVKISKDAVVPPAFEQFSVINVRGEELVDKLLQDLGFQPWYRIIKMASRVFSLSLPSNGQQNPDVVGTSASHTLSSPKEVTLFRNRGIRQIACGLQHTVFVLDDGTVYTYNDHQQLGHDNQGDLSPVLVPSLDSIVQAACGDAHSVVISDKGQIMSWGRDSDGQCGHNSWMKNRGKPRVIKSLSKEFIVQVTCGSKHTLALTKSGKLFAWGDNSSWQLGFSTDPEDNRAEPTEITCLTGLPIKQVSCGGDHSLALTFSGAVFGWGCNKSGQLGKYDERVSTVPHKLDFLQTQQISYILCGQNHSVFLSLTGEVISLGVDSEDTDVDSWSKRVVELKEEADKKITCGKLHTLAFVPSRDQLYIFGPKSPDDSHSTFSNPNHILLRIHESLSGHFCADTLDSTESVVVNNVYCGGLTCYFVASVSLSNMGNPDVVRQDHTLPDHMIYELNEESISLAKSEAALSPSKADPKKILAVIQNVFSSSACLNRSFLTSDHYCCSEENPGLDLARARKTFKKLSDNHNILPQIAQVIHTQLSPTLSTSPPDIEVLRLYLLLMGCPTMQYPELYHQSIFSIAKALCKLSPEMSKVLDTWFGNLLPGRLKHLISIFKNVIVYLVSKQLETSETLIFKAEALDITIVLDVLKKLYKVNEEKDIVPYTSFYVPEINNLLEWLYMRGLVFKVFDYPFILENNVKMQLILTVSQIQKAEAMKEELSRYFWQMMCGILGNMDIIPALPNPLVLTIDRHNIVTSTLKQLNSQPQKDFKKPLRVKFEGEQGADDGGLRKEFFLLIFEKILDPKFGMFKEFSKTGTIWFNPQSFEDRSMFRLVGVLCGLAIYNQVIVDLPFPLALYKKLLKRSVYLSDFEELDLAMAGSLIDFLDYDDFDLHDVFDLYFQISTEFHGEVRTVDLKEGGKDIPVTFDNKQEYVDLYIDYIFNESVKDQYNAFAEGFLQVCGGPVLQLFHPQELMAMVVGDDNYDWEEFEHMVEYRGIFTREHKTIQFFWEVFDEFTLQEKKKFLAFLTGSDRIPVQGMSQLRMTIHAVSDSTDLLPSAYTCFNLLHLPLYESKEKMKEKLLITLEYAQGFGLL